MIANKITFSESKKAISNTVTKFGGQPNWIEAPQWPISKSTGLPMRFICQITLEQFNTSSKIAYIFMTDEEDHIDGTWEPDGGENAIILQPSNEEYPSVKTLKTGPTLYEMVKKLFSKTLVPKNVKYNVTLTQEEEPEFVDESERTGWDDQQWEKYAEALDKNKIKGTPLFLQNTEYPDSGSWNLLMQLDSTSVPFFVNFGDAGIGYAFLSQDGTKAKFLWQCL